MSLGADTGSLSMDEFMRLVGSIGLKSDAEMEQEFEDALRFFDKDGRGLINAQHLKSVLQSYGEPLENEDLNELIKMADIKGDGKIDYLGTYVCHRPIHIYILDAQAGPKPIPDRQTNRYTEEKH